MKETSSESINAFAAGAKTFPLFFLTAAIIFTTAVFVWFVGHIYHVGFVESEVENRLIKISEARGEIVYFDEVLTMSAKMAAATGDAAWEKRYREYEPQLARAIREAETLTADFENSQAVAQTNKANLKLVELENRAFALVGEEQPDAARKILFSDEYETQKKLYAAAMRSFDSELRKFQDGQLADNHSFWSISLIILALVFSIMAWLATIRKLSNSSEKLLSVINEKEQATEALRQSETRFRELFENANDIIFTVDLQGNFTSLNKMVEKTTGYTADEMARMNFAQIVAPESLALVSRMLTDKLKIDAPTKYETEIITKQGNRLTLDVNSRLIVEGAAAVGIQGIARDVTESNEAAENLRKSEQYRNLFKHANDAILMIEPVNETVLNANAKVCAMYGFERDEFIGRSLKSISKNVGRGEEQLEKLLEVGTRREFETVQFRADGAPINLLVNAVVIEYEGQPAVLSINRDITARVKLEEELRKRESQFRSIIETTKDWIWEIDADGNSTYNNPAVETILGYTPEEFHGKSFLSFMCEEDRAEIEESFPRFIAEKRGWTNLVCRWQHKDGSIRFLESTAVPVFDDGGKVIGFRGTDHDITERNQAEEKLRRSEDWLRAILDGSRDGIVVEDDGEIIYINDAYTRQLKYEKPEDLIGRPIADILPPDEIERLSEFGRSRLRGENPPSVYQFAGLCQDGATIEVEGAISTSIVVGKKYIVTAIRDITERKRAEEKLRESRQMLQLVMDTIPQAIWWKDKDSVYIGANRFIAGLAGFDSPEKMVGLSDYDMPWTKEEADFFRECDRRVMESGVAEMNIVEPQLQADGEQAWLNTNKAPLLNIEGEIIGVLGTFEDITEQKRADAALRESEYKLRTLLTSMSEGLLQVDKNEVIEFVNDRFCEMSGYEREELLGKVTLDILFDDDGRKFINEANRQRLKGIAGQYELRLKKKSGETLYTIIGGTPIINAEGAVSGTMGVFTDITERKRAEEQMLHDAFHDGLTGLANRALFIDHLRLTIERGKSRNSNAYAVLFLDFDRFKVVNDSLGHVEGDKLLEQIARRLESATRSGDLAARFGGDEFVVLLGELLDENTAAQVAERIQNSLKKPFNLSGHEIYISASIGIALSNAGHKNPEDMLRDADIAMYRAKAKGRAQYQVFDRRMHQEAAKQLSLETEMRHALEREEFLLHYQPIINLKTEALMGFEALVRWKHPTRGMIPPFEFIGAAEDNGLILPLGAWILQESCRQLRSWQDANPAIAHLSVSVNLSSKQFSQFDLAEQIAATLERAKLDPRCLKLEITESHVMENSEQAIVMMNRLRSLGIELSLDDFGTGYSSLSYLHRLPVNYLKIDRSFVMRMTESGENSEIVSTIIKLAQNLKMKVVAEGIETADQLWHLKNLHCEFGQGYFFSKPLETNAAEIFIDDNLRKSNYSINQPIINLELNT